MARGGGHATPFYSSEKPGPSRAAPQRRPATCPLTGASARDSPLPGWAAAESLGSGAEWGQRLPPSRSTARGRNPAAFPGARGSRGTYRGPPWSGAGKEGAAPLLSHGQWSAATRPAPAHFLAPGRALKSQRCPGARPRLPPRRAMRALDLRRPLQRRA